MRKISDCKSQNKHGVSHNRNMLIYMGYRQEKIELTVNMKSNLFGDVLEQRFGESSSLLSSICISDLSKGKSYNSIKSML